MATANPPSSSNGDQRNGSRRRPASRWLRRAGWVLALIGGITLALSWTTLRQNALTGAAVGARMACSCRYVAGRPLGDCRKDFEPGMGLVRLSEDAEARAVTARVPLIASQTARWHAGPGCMLDPWPN
jgi:hypothetical protein